MKLIFQKKGENDFVGRFHEKFPITAKNPITNAVSNILFKFLENNRRGLILCNLEQKCKQGTGGRSKSKQCFVKSRTKLLRDYKRIRKEK